MQTTGIDTALCQLSYGFRRRVTSYGCYDVNGYRFRSKEHERTKSGLATINSGVSVCCVDNDDNEMEYYGVIKDIIKIKWEGSLQLVLVLFDCDWFDPTPSGTRRTEKLGLVEIKHAARLSVFEPFVMAKLNKCTTYLMPIRVEQIYRSGGLHIRSRPDTNSTRSVIISRGGIGGNICH
jgi:hypothetical protein